LPLYAVVRFEREVMTPEGPKINKTFRQCKWDAAAQTWVPGIKGVQRVIYRLHELTTMAHPHSLAPVFVTEGERDCEALVTLGFQATTAAMGAGAWLPSYTVQLARLTDVRMRGVIVWPDADAPGRAHGLQIVKTLMTYHRGNFRFEWKWLEAPDGAKDAAEWIAQGGTADDLHRLIAELPSNRLPTLRSTSRRDVLELRRRLSR
jgi:DNA primase